MDSKEAPLRAKTARLAGISLIAFGMAREPASAFRSRDTHDLASDARDAIVQPGTLPDYNALVPLQQEDVPPLAHKVFLPSLPHPILGEAAQPLPPATSTPTPTETPPPTPTSTSTPEPTPTPTPELLKGQIPAGVFVFDAPGSRSTYSRLEESINQAAYVGSFQKRTYQEQVSGIPPTFNYDLFKLPDGRLVSIKTGEVPWISDRERVETEQEVWIENTAFTPENPFITDTSERIFASGIRYTNTPTRFEFGYTAETLEEKKQETSSNGREEYGVAVVASEWQEGLQQEDTQLFAIVTDRLGTTRVRYGSHSQVLFESGETPSSIVADLNWDGTRLTLYTKEQDGTLIVLKSIELDSPIPDNNTFLLGKTVSSGQTIHASYTAKALPDGKYDPQETLQTNQTLGDLAGEKGLRMGVSVWQGINFFVESRTIALEDASIKPNIVGMTFAKVQSPTDSGRLQNPNAIRYYQAQGFAPDYPFFLWPPPTDSTGTLEQLHDRLDELLKDVDPKAPGRFILGARGIFDPNHYNHAFARNLPGTAVIKEACEYVAAHAPQLECWYNPGGILTEDIDAFLSVRFAGDRKLDGIQIAPLVGKRFLTYCSSYPCIDKIDEFERDNRQFLKQGIAVEWTSVGVNTMYENDVQKATELITKAAYNLAKDYPDLFAVYNQNYAVWSSDGLVAEAFTLNPDLPAPERTDMYWDMYRTLSRLR